MRDVTERPEAVAAGTVKLVGTHAATILAETERLLDDPAAYQAMQFAYNPYGDGQACQRIGTAIAGWWQAQLAARMGMADAAMMTCWDEDVIRAT